ncbi:hypothetical protein O6H91_Y241500 [Diphasiastrum complanatum]|nr:hypothetical protein O6H91_Y241500 [Diphasiastrum complanatum]
MTTSSDNLLFLKLRLNALITPDWSLCATRCRTSESWRRRNREIRASKKLKVGLTVLKKRCREFGIPRWPHRKLKSLDSLIHNMQEVAKGSDQGGVLMSTVKDELRELENQKTWMQEKPGMDLTDRTKRLRQACFKNNYKRRRRRQQHQHQDQDQHQQQQQHQQQHRHQHQHQHQQYQHHQLQHYVSEELQLHIFTESPCSSWGSL